MADINPTHRAQTINAATHIMENSQAQSLDKINAACQALYPDDLKAIETTIATALKQLITRA